MRIILLAPLVLLAACNPALQETCRVDLTKMDAARIRAMTTLCSKEATPPPAPKRLLSDEIAEGAQRAGMSGRDFINSDAGRFLINRQYWDTYGGVITGIVLIAILSFVTLTLLRMLGRTARKVDTRPFLFGLWHRKVVTEWAINEVDPWLVGILVIGAVVYSSVIYVGVMA